MARATSRQRVLDALRRTVPAPVALPEVDAAALRGSIDELQRQLELAGAEVARLASEFELAERLASYPPFASAARVVSGVPGIPGAERGAPPSAAAHSFDDVDVAIARGEFAVAENGAVWVSDADVPHRALYFLAQHLVLVVSAHEIVADLHAAYARIERAAEPIEARPWRGFIAGPSKTADIEQALVVGAHGPRSLLVALIESDQLEPERTS